jgi:peroxiredoxin
VRRAERAPEIAPSVGKADAVVVLPRASATGNVAGGARTPTLAFLDMATSVSTSIPPVGDVAPDFSLDSTAGKPVRLADSRGQRHVLLAFFPLAFTSTCTAEVCEFSEDFDRYENANVAVLPISVDSVPTLREFKAKHSIRVDMLSDFRREVSRRYGVLDEERFFARRAYVLIDRSGVVQWAHVEDRLGHRRQTDELLARIEALD